MIEIAPVTLILLSGALFLGGMMAMLVIIARGLRR